MSFADIHAKRQAKEAKSHVRSSSTSESKPNSSPPLVEGPPASEELFEALPTSIEIRTSPERGRGIYAKEQLKKGK
jgi:SET and MYND domain-containing protein